MFEGKIRRHIKVSPKKELDFESILQMILDMAETVIKDELVPFVYIENEGEKQGNINSKEEIPFIPKSGTMMRVFTKKSRWSFVAIVRDRDKGFVTLVDVSAPNKDIKKFEEVMSYLVGITKGEIGGNI